ncbi:hypothetical protein [Campylobacter sp. JMF_03 NE3]|uniref:hypothetical protein n=1 Tax=Campylobacter sp. JMF_03 NE3 TaxID=2983831 RepID=UPI0022E9F8B8|nr:hypothetical protein [Campylobacter sp. JMF_03 NE3]MDA3053611.1 hypothetical protein [Campylobacter sp. JMF_03 NE3]
MEQTTEQLKFKSTFILPKYIDDNILEDLRTNFGDKLDFIRPDEDATLSYSFADKKFVFTTDFGQKKQTYLIGNLVLDHKNGLPIIRNNTINKDGLAIVTYDRKQMFGIKDSDTRELAIKLFDFLKDKYDIDIKFSALNSSLGYSQFYFSFDYINPNIQIKEPATLNKTVARFILDKKENFSIGENEFKHLRELLDYERELTTKMALIFALSNQSIITKIIREQENFINTENFAQGSYKHFVIEAMKNNPEGANHALSQMALYISNMISGNSVARRFLCGKNNDDILNRNASNVSESAFQSVFKFYENYPQSSPTITKFLDLLQNYSIEKLNSAIEQEDEISKILKNALTKKTNEIVLLQTINSGIDTIYDTLQIDDANYQNVAILANSKTESGQKKWNNITIDTTNIAPKYRTMSYFEYSNYGAKTFLDLSNVGEIPQDVFLKFTKNRIGYIIDNASNERNIDLPKIKINDDTVAYILGKDEQEKINVTYNSVDDMIMDENVSIANDSAAIAYQMPLSTVRNNFLEFEKNFESRNVERKYIESKKAINEVAKIANEWGESKIIPIHYNTNPYNQSPHIINPNKNTFTEFDKVIELYQKEVFSTEAKGYDLSNPSENKVDPRITFMFRGATDNLGVPMFYDLESEKNKEIFFKIATNAIIDYGNKAGLSREQKTKMIKQTANIVFDEDVKTAILTGDSVIEVRPEITPKNIPIEYLTFATKDYKNKATLPVPYNFFVEEAKKLGYILLDKNRLKIPKLVKETAKTLLNHICEYGEAISGSIANTTDVSIEQIREAAKNILLDGKTNPCAEQNMDTGFNVKSKSDILASNNADIVKNMTFLLEVAEKYYKTYCKYPTINEIKEDIFKHEPLTKATLGLRNRIEICLDNLYDSCAKEDKKDEYQENMQIFKDIVKSEYESKGKVQDPEKLANDSAKKLEVAILRATKIRDNVVQDSVDRVAFALIHHENFKILQKEFNKLEADYQNLIKDKTLSKETKAKIIEAFNLSAGNIIGLVQDAYFARFSAKDKSDTVLQPASVNKLRMFQAQSALNMIFLDPNKKEISAEAPPRTGKTRMVLLALMLAGVGVFYGQKKNLDDIIEQVVDMSPEMVGLLGLQNYKDTYKFYNNDMITYYFGKTPVASIPTILYDKGLLEEVVSSKNNLDTKHNLFNVFSKEIHSMLSASADFINKHSEAKLSKEFRSKEISTQNPFYALYDEMKQIAQKTYKQDLFANEEEKNNLFYAPAVSAMTLYTAKLYDDGYITDDNVESAKTGLLEWYSNVVAKIKNTNNVRLVIASKNDPNNELPNESVFKAIAERNKDLNTKTIGKSINKNSSLKINGGIYELNIDEKAEDNESFPYVFNSLNDPQIQNIKQNCLDNIALTSNSTLRKMGEKNTLVIIPNWTLENGNKVKNPEASSKKILQELMGIAGQNTPTTFTKIILDTYKETIVKFFMKEGVDRQAAQRGLNEFLENNGFVQNLTNFTEHIYRSLGNLDDKLIKNLSVGINDITKDNEPLTAYKIKIDNKILEDYSAEFSQQIRHALVNANLDVDKKEQLIAQLEAVNENIAQVYNENMFKKHYELSCLPVLKLSKKYEIDSPRDIAHRLDAKNEANSISFNFAVLSDSFYHRSILDAKTGMLHFTKFQLTGKKYDFDSNTIQPNALKNYEASMTISRNPQNNAGLGSVFKVEQTNDIYQYFTRQETQKNNNRKGQKAEVSINSRTLVTEIEDFGIKPNIVAIDESHKETGEATIKSITNVDKVVKVSGTPKIELPSQFSILDIRSPIAGLLISLYRTFPRELNDISKGCVDKFRKDNVLDRDVIKRAILNIPDIEKHLMKYGIENLDVIDPGKILTSSPDAIKKFITETLAKELNDLADFMHSVIKGVKDDIVSSIRNGQRLGNADVPNFIYDSKVFLDKYLQSEKADTKFDVKKLCLAARVAGVHFQDGQQKEILRVTYPTRNAYNVLSEENLPYSDENRHVNLCNSPEYYPNFFHSLYSYSYLNKLSSMKNRIDIVVDAFFDSLKNTDEMENNQILKNDQENTVADENRAKLKSEIDKSGLDISYEELMVTNTKTPDTSAQELTKELLKNNGNLPDLENKSEKLSKKIQFIKEHIIPAIAPIINSSEYYDRITPIANTILHDETKNYAYSTIAGYPYTIMFNKNLVANDEISYEADLYIDNKCTLRKNHTDEKMFFSFYVLFDENSMRRFFPLLNDAIDSSKFKPFKDKISCSNTKSAYYAYDLLSSGMLNAIVRKEDDKKFPVFTERIATNLLANLKILEETIRQQNIAMSNGKVPPRKTIFSLATDQRVQGVLKSIDKDYLKRQYNIDFVLVTKTDDFQPTINQLNEQNKNPDILILPTQQVAEGTQIYNDNKGSCMVFADGKEFHKDIATGIQAISRILTPQLRQKYEKNGIFTFEPIFLGKTISFNTRGSGFTVAELARKFEMIAQSDTITGKDLEDLNASLGGSISIKEKESNAIAILQYILDAYANEGSPNLNTSASFAEISSKLLDKIVEKTLSNEIDPKIEDKLAQIIDDQYIRDLIGLIPPDDNNLKGPNIS